MTVYLGFAMLVGGVLTTLLTNSFGLVGLVLGGLSSWLLGVMASDADKGRRGRR